MFKTEQSRVKQFWANCSDLSARRRSQGGEAQAPAQAGSGLFSFVVTNTSKKVAQARMVFEIFISGSASEECFSATDSRRLLTLCS
jgi:hypothetical protein